MQEIAGVNIEHFGEEEVASASEEKIQ